MLKRLLLIGLVPFFVACSGSEALLHDLPERDANEIIAVLYGAQIDASKKLDPKSKAYTVLVAKGDTQRATATLAAIGLPRAPRPSLNEVFKSNGFAPTPFEERIRFIYGTTQELERTISLMNGVLATRVHVVIPEQAKRGVTPEPAKASILINHDSKVNLALEIPAIRRLVAESVSGLSPDRVEVLLTPVTVDLSRIAATPMASLLGVRIHASDSKYVIALIGVLLAIIGGLSFALYKFIPKRK